MGMDIFGCILTGEFWGPFDVPTLEAMWGWYIEQLYRMGWNGRDTI